MIEEPVENPTFISETDPHRQKPVLGRTLEEPTVQQKPNLTPTEALGLRLKPKHDGEGIDIHKATEDLTKRNAEVRDFPESQEAWKKEIAWFLDKVKAGVYTEDEFTTFFSTVIAEMQSNSERDPLTKLYKRNAFEEAAKKALARADRKGEEMTVAIIDLDHFKSINDTFGHDAGDNVLRAVGKYLSSSIRGDDVVARWGGEEIALLLPSTNKEQAALLLQRILNHMPENIKDWLDSFNAPIDRMVTASIGFTDSSILADKRTGTLSELLQAADEALYNAKNGINKNIGRDRAVYKDADGVLKELTPQRS